jgi:hypothetical protein
VKQVDGRAGFEPLGTRWTKGGGPKERTVQQLICTLSKGLDS